MSSLKIPTKANLWWWSTHHRKVLNMSSSTAVVILCGGRLVGGSVFPKRLMQVNGKPLFKVVEENLSPLGLPVYLVSKVPFESGGVPLILDIFEADTPLAGVLTALSTLQYQNYLFTAVDMPLLPKEALLPLLKHAYEHESSVFYSINGFLQPFPSLVQSSVDKRILACYHQQLYKLTEVFSSIPHVLLPYMGDLNVLSQCQHVERLGKFSVFSSILLPHA